MATFKQRPRRSAAPVRSSKSFFKRSASVAKFPSLKTSIPKKPNLPEPIKIETKPEEPAKVEPAEAELEEINRMIKQASQRLSELEPEEEYLEPEPGEVAEAPGVVVEPEEFNGVSDSGEAHDLLQAQLEAERKKAQKLEEKLRLIETEFEEEKNKLHSTVRTLKQEMHRTEPILENKFFSLSRQLRLSVEAVEKLREELNGPAADTASATIPSFVPKAADTAVTPTITSPKVVMEEEKKEETPAPTPEELAKQSSKKKKKLLITGGAAVAVLMLMSAGLSWKLMAPARVDDKLVGEYLNKAGAGEVKGVTTSSTGNAGSAPQAQAEVPFNDTVWETIKEPMIGVELQSPANTVGIIKSDNSLTFSRKTGYIFKIQKIETKFDLKEYWDQVQATSLNYGVSETQFKGRSAYHLVLEDATDYPGNRYLLKDGDYIFDIWYATPSNKFNADDIQRAEKMLESLKFTK